mgnify:CR=1 FL=1
MNTCKATLRVLFSHRAYLLIYLVFVGIMMLSISWSMLSGTSDSAAAAFEPAKNACRRHRSRLGQGAASRHRCAHTCRIPANW